MSIARLPVRLALMAFALLGATTRLGAQAAPAFTLDGNTLVVPTPMTFATGTDQLTSASDSALAHVAAYLGAKSYISLLRVEGHVTAGGDAEALQALSERRARAVVRALVARGVDCKRLLPVGFGNAKPVVANDAPDARARNSRVMFVNAGLRGRAIGGMAMDGGGVVAGDPCG